MDSMLPLNINKEKNLQINSVPLTQFYINTLHGDYGADGIGLFQTGSGIIDMSQEVPLTATIEKAYLYWIVARFSESPVKNTGFLNNQQITGFLIGTEIINNISIDAFREDVTGIASSSINNLSNFPNTIEYNTYGASLVIIYSDPTLPCKTVLINDGIVFLRENSSDTTFQNFTASSLPQAKTTYIAGSGGVPPNNNDRALFNGTIIGNNIFNRSSGDIWDNDSFDVSLLVNGWDTSATARVESISPFPNHFFWITQVFSVTSLGCNFRGINFL